MTQVSEDRLAGEHQGNPDPDFLTPEEAAAYLGVTPQEFGLIEKRYGIGRRHLPVKHRQIVYATKDLAVAKKDLDEKRAAVKPEPEAGQP